MRRIPAIVTLVSQASERTDGSHESNQLSAYLEKARQAVAQDGNVAQSLGASGAVAVVVGARALKVPEADALAIAVTSALTSEVAGLTPKIIAELALELGRQRVRDAGLWRAMADAVVAAEHVGPATVVALLDGFRRALGGNPRVDDVFADLSRRACQCEEELNDKQLVAALGSLSRLGNHIKADDQRRSLQLLLDRWLSRRSDRLADATPSQVVSLAVSLTNVSESLGVRTEGFVNSASIWALETAVPGALTSEEIVVLLWALKELTHLGLRPHRALAAGALSRLREDHNFEKYGLLRLAQASEVILAARHALDGMDTQLTEALVEALADSVERGCPPDMLVRLVALWDQVGEEFWTSAPRLAQAIAHAATAHVDSPRQRASALHPLLDTLAASSFGRTRAFEAVRPALLKAASGRADASDPALAASIRALAEPPASESAPPPPREAASQAARARPSVPLSPADLAEQLGTLCRRNAPEEDVVATANVMISSLDRLTPDETAAAVPRLLAGARRRLARTPVLLDVVEALGDAVVQQADELSTLQLTTALSSFAEVGLPHHLLFETVLTVVLQRQLVQGISWAQVVGILEAFAAVRLRIPELAVLYGYLRDPQELARLPTMALVRFFSAAARLELCDRHGADASELVDRVLAETTPSRPLPLDSSVVLVQSLLLSKTVLLDRQLRHLLAWVASTRVQQLTAQQLAVLRQYCLFVLAQPDIHDRGCLLRLPVETQRFVSGILRHRASAWRSAISDTTRQFRGEVDSLLEIVSAGSAANGHSGSFGSVILGPAGVVDLQVGRRGLLLDGPESFFRPFTSTLQYTPQEQRRGWLLERLLSDEDVRGCVADFFPPAAGWPMLDGLRRVNWQEWCHAPHEVRQRLLDVSE